MDWHLMTDSGPGPVSSAASPVPPGVPAPSRPSRVADPGRMDLALAAVIERQAHVVVSGMAVAAVYGGDAAAAGPTCPPWLAADVDLGVQLIRLATAAGVNLPSGLAPGPGDQPDPRRHLAACRACYRQAIDVLGRMGSADDLGSECRADALRVLRLVERRLNHLGDGHPAGADEAVSARRSGAHVAEPVTGGFLPGQLLG